MSNSPYQPPYDATRSPIDENRPDEKTPSLLPFAQLGLRLLGVMLVVDGVGALLGGLIQGLLQAQAYADAGYPVPIDPHSAGWVAGGMPHLVAGLYLTFSGRWVLHKVFTASRQQFADTSS